MALLIATPLSIYSTRFAFGAPIIHADEMGLWWQRGKKLQLIPWQSMHFFTYIRDTTSSQRPNSSEAAYIVWADEGYYIWLQKTHLTLEEEGAAQTLNSLIVTQAQIPLYDLTQIANELRRNRMDLRRVVAKRKRDGGDVSVLEPLVARWSVVTPRERVLQAARITLAAVLAVPVLAFTFLGIQAQSHQSAYFAELPARIRQQQPIYHNSLTQVDPLWPTHVSGNDVAFDATFTPQGYRVHGLANDRFIAVKGPGVYGDAAIAVTVHPGTSETDMASAGIVVRADANGSQALVLSLGDSTDDVQVCNLNNTRIDDGCRPLNDETNRKQRGDVFAGSYRLLVVMHGDSFLLYVDDQLYCTYNDAARLVGSAGGFGLYSSNAVQTVTFSDLAIYPAGGAMPWDYV
jgi:hypothetical protein